MNLETSSQVLVFNKYGQVVKQKVNSTDTKKINMLQKILQSL